MKTGFAVGDRVVYNDAPGDRLNGHQVTGKIVAIVHRLAMIRPDDAETSGLLLTRRSIRDIRKEAE